ncbi:hypothetical protein T4B_492 [Trichinella pseudospiralis]|uniref:Uncharacterized protein n=1 Tax=Trichinella pseudospiralis TaxID=6337 RepID=A0A0V0XSB7_TRIPS|nr:hypothetical protein T4E_10392 [Trichinella pseudospiralis]KRY67224.1 hypothetical protein T4A_13066 [Trichinella pseudospiralis]KRZ22607.1 hypothetical protein T4B_492 [Trichinella pseudospiralis]KRZ35738.1 hypothetical protein T4C_625 [Trichinella pseudospiralis]
MTGLLGRGLRFGSKSGISAGRDLVKKRCIFWSACCSEPSQCVVLWWRPIFAPNFNLNFFSLRPVCLRNS